MRRGLRSKRGIVVGICGGMVLLLAACGGKNVSNRVDPAQLAAGKGVYETYCAACRGIDGQGEPNWKVPDVNGIYPAPPHDASGHTWHHADAVLIQVMGEGSGVPNSKMPVFGPILTPAQMDDVLVYIKSFWGQDERDFQQQMTEQWKELNR